MPSNTPGGFPWPLPTEPVAEGAQAVRNLAEAVDKAVRIEDRTLAAATTPITFAAIPQTFAHLFIRLQGRSDFASNAQQLVMRFNDDASAAYDNVETTMSNGSVTCAGGLGATAAFIGEVPGASAIANSFSGVSVDIFNYRSAFQKAYAAHCFSKRGQAASGDLMLRYTGGSWRGLGAITKIALLPSNGNFVVGSRATLYGLIGP